MNQLRNERMTKAKLPVPSAQNINEAHQCAKESAENAVEWAIKCGQLLAAKKEDLKHGEFLSWVESNCDFSVRSAQLYMKAADQTRNALRFSSLRELLAPASPAPKTDTTKGAVSVVNPEGGRTTAAKEGTEETGADRPAAPIFDAPPAAPKNVTPALEAQLSDLDEPERPDLDEDEEDAALARAEARAKEDRDRRVDKILESDDQLAEALKQLAQQAALIGTLETTRDSYMRGKEAVTKLLQAEQRKTAKLEKELSRLRERITSLEAA